MQHYPFRKQAAAPSRSRRALQRELTGRHKIGENQAARDAWNKGGD
jgi:hypothetical protein